MLQHYTQAIAACQQLYSNHLATKYYYHILVPLILIQQYLLYSPFPARHYFYSDPATFMYGGNLLIRGYSPYLYLFDIKPPAIYDTTALIALLAPTDILLQYWIGAFLTSLLAAITILLAATLVYRLTSHNIAALATGLTIFAYPYFLRVPELGIWPKYFTLAFGLGAIYCCLNDRHVIGAVLGALAAGYWQFGAIFAVIVLLDAYRTETTPLWQPVVAMGGTTAVVLAPIVLIGGAAAVDAMIYQVIVFPFLLPDQAAGLVDRIQTFQHYVRYSWPLFYGGVLVSGYYVVRHWRDAWWLGFGVGWALLQIGFLDFDSAPDPFMLVVFASIGLGLFIGSLNRRQQIGITLALCTLMAGQVYDRRHMLLDKPRTDINTDPETQAFVSDTYPPITCFIGFGGIAEQRRATNPSSLPQRCTSETAAPFT